MAAGKRFVVTENRVVRRLVVSSIAGLDDLRGHFERMVLRSIGPIQKDRNHGGEHQWPARSDKLAVADRTMEPIIGRSELLDSLERLVEELRIGQLDFECPAWVVECGDADAVCMLPIAVTVREIPSLKPL